MRTYNVNVNQTFIVKRSFTVPITATSADAAENAVLKRYAKGVPEFKDPSWVETWRLDEEWYEAEEQTQNQTPQPDSTSTTQT